MMNQIHNRFWSKAEVSQSWECWDWKAAEDKHGYGLFRRDGRMDKSHRVAWELANDLVPEGLCVLHHCDNPACVNPSHLFLGTHTDNMRDMISKGRKNHPRGSAIGISKLNEDEVQIIRWCGRRGCGRNEIAEVFGVTHQTISDIITMKTWTHLG